MDRTSHHNGEHDSYEMKFRIDERKKEGNFELKKFEGVSKVHVKVAG
jgi:hypothetical protein